MTPTEKLREIILPRLGAVTETPAGFLKRDCMLCHTRGHGRDTRKRFGIKFEAQGLAINCFNCGFKTSWHEPNRLSAGLKTFLQEIGVPLNDIRYLDFMCFKEAHDGFEASESSGHDYVYDWEPMGESLLYGAKTFTEWADEGCEDENFLQCVQYCAERKILWPDELMWSPALANSLRKRLIIPFRFNNKLCGYAARYVGTPPSKKVRKYHTEVPKGGFVFNYDLQVPENKYVIVCEGILDAMGTGGVSCLSNTMNLNQIALIERLNKQVIMVPDRDHAGEPLVETAIERGWGVAFPPWDNDVKDAADAGVKYGWIATVQSILENVYTRPFEIRLKRKMEKY